MKMQLDKSIVSGVVYAFSLAYGVATSWQTTRKKRAWLRLLHKVRACRAAQQQP
jgi:hypothetical protein